MVNTSCTWAACPQCPDSTPWFSPPPQPDPNCMCGKPLMIVIPAGQHIHPCPVHPSFIVYGSGITL